MPSVSPRCWPLRPRCPKVTTSIELRDYFFFDVTLTSTSVGSTQFFWDFGKGFTEYDSSRQPIRLEPKPVVYRFMMPMGRFKALRFDPIDGAGVFTFSHAQVVDLKGHVMKRFAPGDLVLESGIVRATVRGDAVEVVTDSASNDPILSLRLDQPLVLEPGPRIWFAQGWPTFLGVFLLGCLLGLPPVAARLSRLAAGIATAAQRRPARAIMAAAAVAVAIQCHPVLFQGRSFVSPNNGGHMLYDDLPTLPGDTDPSSTNTGSSDTGAMLFQHLYFPMVQHDALARGQLPLWNRYSLGGEPLLGQGQSMFGDPFNFLTIAADGAAWAWDIRFVLAHWILAAALGGIVWRLTRHLGAAALTAASAAFLGFFTFVSPIRRFQRVLFAADPARVVRAAHCHHAAATRKLAGCAGRRQLDGHDERHGEGSLHADGRSQLRRRASSVAAARDHWPPLARVGSGHPGGWWLHPAFGPGLGFVSQCLAPFDDRLRHPAGQHAAVVAFHRIFDDIFYRQTSKDENVVAPALNFLFLAGVLWWVVQPRAWRTPRLGVALLLAAFGPFVLAFGLVPNAVILKIPFIANIVHVGNTFSCVLMILFAVLAGLGFRDAWKRLREPDAPGVIVRLWVAGLALALLFFLTTRQFPKSPFFTGYASALAIAIIALPLGVHWGLRKPTAPGALWVVLFLGLPLLGWRHMQFRETKFEQYAFVPGPRSDFHARSPAIETVDAHKPAAGRVVGWNSALYALLQHRPAVGRHVWRERGAQRALPGSRRPAGPETRVGLGHAQPRVGRPRSRPQIRRLQRHPLRRRPSRWPASHRRLGADWAGGPRCLCQPDRLAARVLQRQGCRLRYAREFRKIHRRRRRPALRGNPAGRPFAAGSHRFPTMAA